ncbi:unnamed protein product, partial [marine sediment metagenome]
SAIKYVEKATRRAEEWFDIVGNTINIDKPRKEPPIDWNKYDSEFYKYWKLENFGYYYFEVPTNKEN